MLQLTRYRPKKIIAAEDRVDITIRVDRGRATLDAGPLDRRNTRQSEFASDVRIEDLSPWAHVPWPKTTRCCATYAVNPNTRCLATPVRFKTNPTPPRGPANCPARDAPLCPAQGTCPALWGPGAQRASRARAHPRDPRAWACLAGTSRAPTRQPPCCLPLQRARPASGVPAAPAASTARTDPLPPWRSIHQWMWAAASPSSASSLG